MKNLLVISLFASLSYSYILDKVINGELTLNSRVGETTDFAAYVCPSTMQHFMLEPNSKFMFYFPPVNSYYHETYGEDYIDMVNENSLATSINVRGNEYSGTLESFGYGVDGTQEVKFAFNN